jgi:hypothetical protein
MVDVVGRSHDLLLFAMGDESVVVDTRDNTIVNRGRTHELTSMAAWEGVDPTLLRPVWADLARAELTNLNVIIAAANTDRKYTVPKAVQAEAKKALAWRGMLGRGGTGVAMNMAHKLSLGKQIDIKRVRHMAKYLQRHEADSLSSGWAPSEATYPSTARINWSLFGGNAGLRWARSIIAQADSNAITAGAYLIQPLEPFNDENSIFVGKSSPEDPFDMSALYLVLPDDDVYRWDSGDWYQIDEDDEWDPEDDLYVELDRDTALLLSGMLEEKPDGPCNMFSILGEEAELAWNGMPYVDWEMVDRVMVAAGTQGGPVKPTGSGDGQYSPEERSKNASRQVRDANGRFVKVGYHGINSKNRAVTIIGVSERGDGQVTVVDDETGERTNMPASEFRSGLGPPGGGPITPLDLSKILGQPRATASTPKAWLKALLPPMDAAHINRVLDDYRGDILAERAKYKGKFPHHLPQYPPGTTPGKKNKPSSGTKVGPATKVAKPRKRKNPPGRVFDGPGRIYNSTLSFYEFADLAGEPALTPDTSDVPPLYLAIVAPDDVQAVTDLIALVPQTKTNPEPTTFRRVGGTWVPAPDVMIDLKSPTPPAVVQLDEATFNDVVVQVDASNSDGAPQAAPVDSSPAPATPAPVAAGLGQPRIPLWGPNGEIMMLVAAGNVGGAEKLRLYWTVGKGGLKIRWGTGGDWRRCVKHLEKYMGPRAKGYCQLRHHEMTGMWTGDKGNVGVR